MHDHYDHYSEEDIDKVKKDSTEKLLSNKIRF